MQSVDWSSFTWQAFATLARSISLRTFAWKPLRLGVSVAAEAIKTAIALG